MMGLILAYTGAAFVSFWGFSHLFPTKNVVAGFGAISADNRNIITMEWIVEGVALIFIGALVATVTVVDAASPVSRAVYWLVVIVLNALSVVSLFTGFKVKFVPFKLCPVIFTVASVLILLGMYL